jgi:hypothetical protein
VRQDASTQASAQPAAAAPIDSTADDSTGPVAIQPAVAALPADASAAPSPRAAPPQAVAPTFAHAPAPASTAPAPGPVMHAPMAWPDTDGSRPTCTVAQLRRFIKSRPWIPMHELRRRFGINGDDDDVAPMHVGGQTLFIGLPPAEGRLMAELLGAGDVGYELSLDPITPVVVGVYPMRPVPRG